MSKRDWLQVLIAPIIVGIVIAVVGFGIDRYKSSRKVSAVIEGPFGFAQIQELFDTAKISFKIEVTGKSFPDLTPKKPVDPRAPSAPTGLGVNVEVNVDDLQLYKVTITNTGNSPIRDLPIRFVFENASDRFRLIAVKHKTNPAVEFGEIKSDFSQLSSPRFVYQLLNQGDQDVITVLAGEKRDLKVYSKGEGVSFDLTSVSENRPTNWFLLVSLSAVLGMLAGVISSFVGRFLERKKEPPEIFVQ
jgi:hypothetical protein